jgi:hypothetical protein
VKMIIHYNKRMCGNQSPIHLGFHDIVIKNDRLDKSNDSVMIIFHQINFVIVVIYVIVNI